MLVKVRKCRSNVHHGRPGIDGDSGYHYFQEYRSILPGSHQFVAEFSDGSLPLFPSYTSGVIDGGIHDLAGCESIIAFAGRCHYVYRYVLDNGLYLL